MDQANWYKDESKWVASYIRHKDGEAYLVVINSDPFVAHTSTIHMTTQDGQDPFGALWAMGVANDSRRRYRFIEVFSRPGFIPRDPAVSGEGVPGDILFRSGNVPSGLHLGDVPAATTYVFKIEVLAEAASGPAE